MVLSFPNIKMSNNNSLKTQFKFRRIMYILGNILCLTPWYDFEKRELKKPVFNKLYAVICGTIFGAMIIGSTFLKSIHKRDNIFESLLLSLNSAIWFYLMEYLIFGSSFIKHRKWEKLMRKFLQDDGNTGECTVCASVGFQFVLGHTYFIAVVVYHTYEWYASIGIGSIFHSAVAVIPEYYCFLCAMISSVLALYLCCLYKDLNSLLEKHTEDYFSKRPQGCSEVQYVTNVLDVGKRYKKILELVSYYNDIFGMATLLIFFHSIIQILRCVILALRIMDNPKLPWTMAASVLLGFTVSMAESVYIILCCEQAASAGKKMKQLCHKLQENFEVQSRARKELFKLAETVKSYEPKFTAANFFVIKQGTILKIINISTTYLIVIIQFYGTVRERHLRQNIENNRTN